MSGLGDIEDKYKVRSAYDLERKYKLGELSRNQETTDNQILNLQTELENFVEATTDNFEDVQEQLDGKVETWYYSGIPSLSNLPASNWTTSDEKDKHIGDLYYDRATGYVYRFELDTSVTPNVYKWQEIHDEKAVDALSIANDALDTADSKRRIFTSQPTPPYDNGDLWVQGSTGDIKACQVARQEGSYVATDWILASKYTDNTYASAIVDELGGTTTTILSGQVVQEMANYTKFTDLATGGSTTIAGENITTGSIRSANYVQDVSGTKITLSTGVIDTKGFKVDSSGNVTATAGAIGGFTLNSTSFTKALNGLYNYDTYDLEWCRGIILGNSPKTNSALDVLDYNGDDDVKTADYININKVVNNQQENTKVATGTFEINSNNAKKCVAVKDSNNNYIAYMGLGGIGAENITCESIAISNKTDNENYRIDFNGHTGIISVTGDIYLGTADASNSWKAIKTKRDSTQAINNFTFHTRSGSSPYLEFRLDDNTGYGVDIWYSDKRLKHDIKDSNYKALDTIKKIKHREFIYNDCEKYIPIGYVADELEEIDKNFIYEVGDDKFKYPDKSYIIPILSKAIQEQQEQIEELRHEIELLKKEK